MDDRHVYVTPGEPVPRGLKELARATDRRVVSIAPPDGALVASLNEIRAAMQGELLGGVHRLILDGARSSTEPTLAIPPAGNRAERRARARGRKVPA